MVTEKQIGRELLIGTKIEKREHGFSIPISKKIASDHIKEFLRYKVLYYTDKRYGLIAMERKMKKHLR